MAHVETTCECTEGRHEQAYSVACEAAPPQRPPSPAHTGHGMQMSGNLACASGRVVAKDQGADGDPVVEGAADVCGHGGIVIAFDPDPVAAALNGSKRG